MPDAGLWQALLRQVSTEGSRSTALKPMGGLIAMLLPATFASYYWMLPLWVSVAVAIAAGVSIIIYLGSYLYLLATDRDAVRSEKYSLQKLAIQKATYGDSISGTIEGETVDDPRLLTSESSNEGDRS